MDLMGMEVDKNMRNMRVTVLRRSGGTWNQEEVGRLANGLMTSVSGHPKYPEYVVLWGHHSAEAALKALGKTMQTIIVLQTIGIVDNKDVPFRPEFI